jgi:hypothetical protein
MKMHLSFLLAIIFGSSFSFGAQEIDMSNFVKSLKHYGCKVSGQRLLGADDGALISITEYFSAKTAEDAAYQTVIKIGIRKTGSDIIYDYSEKLGGGIVIVDNFRCFEQ